MTSILEQLGDNANDDTDQEEGIRLGKHLKRLNELLRGKKYLIVLDDVWHMNDFYSDLAGGVEDDNTWDRLSHGLPKDSGGAVMVTDKFLIRFSLLFCFISVLVFRDYGCFHYSSLLPRSS